MTFLDAAEKAAKAKTSAQMAWRDAAGSSKDHQEHLARSVQLLAEAVEELASSLHRSS